MDRQLSAKQQKIQNRHLTEISAMDAHNQRRQIVNDLAAGVLKVRLMINDLIEQDDVFLLNEQLTGKSARDQAEILEVWMAWIEAREKFDRCADGSMAGYAVGHFQSTWLWSKMGDARRKVEAI